MNTHIRHMTAADIDGLVATFDVWHKYRPQYERYWEQHQQGKRVVLLALADETVAGYVTLVWKSTYVPFREAGIPEIVDLNVITLYQKQGIGTALIRACEQIAVEHAIPVIGIGTGTTPDYAAAQRLYPALGYIDDGRGIIHDEYFLTKKL
jgi:GNAT superfamily N-acetyltransferase